LALSSNAGDSNFAFGNSALRNNTTGANNIAIGECALATNISGSANVAIGDRALRFTNNIGSIGLGPGAGSYNSNINSGISIGCNAGFNVNGASNIAIGVGALSLGDGLTGSNNIAIGSSAGVTINGNENIHIGSASGAGSVGSGSIPHNYNVGIGSNSLVSSINGCNVAIGTYALYNVTFGGGNIAIGVEALRNFNGTGTKPANDNIAIGYQALRNSQTMGSGSLGNIAIGNNAGPANSGATDSYNSIYLGSMENLWVQSGVVIANTIFLGDPSLQHIYTNATLQVLSDQRDKTDIVDIPVGLEFIRDIRPVKFTWNTRDGAKGGIQEGGFIAQELKEVVDRYEINEWLKLVDDRTPEQLKITPAKLIPMIVKAIQTLADQDDKELAELTLELEELKKKIG
jgi:hypothetical protein